MPLCFHDAEVFIDLAIDVVGPKSYQDVSKVNLKYLLIKDFVGTFALKVAEELPLELHEVLLLHIFLDQQFLGLLGLVNLQLLLENYFLTLFVSFVV